MKCSRIIGLSLLVIIVFCVIVEQKLSIHDSVSVHDVQSDVFSFLIIPSLPSSVVPKINEKLKSQFESEYMYGHRSWSSAKNNIEEKVEHLSTTSPTSFARTSMGPVLNSEPTVYVEQTGKTSQENNTIWEGHTPTDEAVEHPVTTLPLQESQQNTTHISPSEPWQSHSEQPSPEIVKEQREFARTNTSCPFAGIPERYKRSNVIKPTAHQLTRLHAARSLPPPKADWKELNDRYASGQLAHRLPFDSTPRSAFYSISNVNVTHAQPLLMDAFTYCEQESLIVETIFNLKYMYRKMGRQTTRDTLRDVWSATLLMENTTVINQMKEDNHKHTLFLVFVFSGMCNVENRTFFVQSHKTQYNYTVTPPFIPSFTEHHFYLSACTVIDRSPPSQVSTWIRYHYYHGVEHFTIYLNAKPDFWNSYLHPFIEKGLLNVVEYTYPNHKYLYEQASALISCNRRYRFLSDFVMYNDVDEYMIPINSEWRLQDIVHMYDHQFPSVNAFRVYNTFHACSNYSYKHWEHTNNLLEICPLRWKGIVRDGRWKQIVRPCRIPYVQVHHVSYVESLFINAQHDMVMLHFKFGFNRKPSVRYALNPVVIEGMKHPI